MECATCGSQVRAGAMFCGDCGTRVDPRVTVPVATAPAVAAAPAPSAPTAQTVWAPPPLLPDSTTVLTRPGPSSVAVERTFAPMTVSVSTPEAEDDDLDLTVIAPRTPMWQLMTPDGEHHAIRSTTVIGRRPSRPVTYPDAELLGLIDPTRSLSKSHAVLVPSPDGLVITDLGSTNGIVIVAADGRETDVPSGRPTLLSEGMRLELGEFVIVIARP